ncbi:protein-tyrosine sulfotransferase 2 [Marmota marmota marmota]|uniref:protein-tyrosine sulfotransferase 2 n=1 Tax=Marmota marmota marmota TaxID=9994 RepID=UPI0020934011|nr:protein-tyrosine sulfotransferase 2 [Marmota marmota marmota]
MLGKGLANSSSSFRSPLGQHRLLEVSSGCALTSASCFEPHLRRGSTSLPSLSAPLAGPAGSLGEQARGLGPKDDSAQERCRLRGPPADLALKRPPRAHPEVRCGEEPRIIPRVLAMRQSWSKSGREKLRLDEAGVTDEVLDAAMQAFILEVIAKHGEPARVLCNKDPFTLKSSVYLSRLFPNSKFLLMVRDGRASVHSMITRKVTIAGFDLSSYRDCLTKWNKAIEVMYSQCMEVGRDKCLPVYYEQLVLHPRRSLQLILDFLGIAWSDAVLHHEDLIGKPGGVSLSKIERSTDQVIKPVNLEALSKWTGHIPRDVVRDMARIAPMLARLGYDPYANPPNYGDPDPIVINNTQRVLKGDYKTPANLKGYFQVNQNSTSSHLGSS